MIGIDTIITCCPGDTVTGGPELQHQFIDALQAIGRDAYMCYFPFDVPFACPKPYQHYNVPSSAPIDTPSTLVVLPETATNLARQFKKAQIAIWWLSVDNFWGFKRNGWVNDLKFVIRRKLDGRLPFSALKSFRHFAQSYYAYDYLQRRGIKAELLTDYLNEAHFVPKRLNQARLDIVVFNPKKSGAQIANLAARFPDIAFVPIQNMTESQVAELLSSAKIYADFGFHPGKDRMPREAAMAGCCVITGRKGAAKFNQDLPISERYKLDEARRIFPEEFRKTALSIFSDFEPHFRNFDVYRDAIRAEREQFHAQIRNLFGPDTAVMASVGLAESSSNDIRALRPAG